MNLKKLLFILFLGAINTITNAQSLITTEKITITDGATTDFILRSDAIGNASWVDPVTLLGIGPDKWGTSGLNIYNLNTGNVGIGTSNPRHTLDLGNSLGQKLAIYQNSGGNSFYGLGVSGSTLEFHSGSIDATAAPKMVVKANGRVGIGTLNPLAELEVVGVISARTPGSSTGSVSLSSPGGNPGLIFFSNAPDNLRADIGRSSIGLHLGASSSNVASAKHLNIANNGYVGVGTTAPVSILDVANSFYAVTGNIVVRPQNTALEGGEITLLSPGTSATPVDWKIDNYDDELRIFNAAGTPSIYFQGDGKVKIGNGLLTPGNYKLYIKDGLMTERVKIATVSSIDWADYVFADDYDLKPLKEIEHFVQTNKHLPNIPSAKTIESQGYEVQKMDALLLEKIEELYLHSIRLEKENKALLKRIEKLENK